MGGMGSGERWGRQKRGLCERFRKIDLRDLQKDGALKPGVRGSMSWTRDGEKLGTIAYMVQDEALLLAYGLTDGKSRKAIRENVRIINFAQPFGGTRRYFECPYCYGRCLILYLEERFRCRECCNLAYASQNEGTVDRRYRKLRKLRARLGGNDNPLEPLPLKPKGMHWQTYLRLRTQAETLEQQNLAYLNRQLEHLKNRLRC